MAAQCIKLALRPPSVGQVIVILNEVKRLAIGWKIPRYADDDAAHHFTFDRVLDPRSATPTADKSRTDDMLSTALRRNV